MWIKGTNHFQLSVCPSLLWSPLQQQKHPCGWICDHTGKGSREKLLDDGSLYPIKVWKPWLASVKSNLLPWLCNTWQKWCLKPIVLSDSFRDLEKWKSEIVTSWETKIQTILTNGPWFGSFNNLMIWEGKFWGRQAGQEEWFIDAGDAFHSQDPTEDSWKLLFHISISNNRLDHGKTKALSEVPRTRIIFIFLYDMPASTNTLDTMEVMDWWATLH